LSETGLEEGTAEDEEDPRWELVCKLIEYKKIKEAAASLQVIEAKQLQVYTRTAGEFPDQQYALVDESLKKLSVWELMEAFKAVMDSMEVAHLKSAIPKPEISIKQRMAEILQLVEAEKQISFKSVFSNVTTKIDLITCFLAVLELIRLRKLEVYQANVFDDIIIKATYND
jgi:segregation and condensation protein A